MSQTIEAPVEVRLPDEDEEYDHDRPWIVIVWNDPINLMSYVTFVLRKLFGFSKEEATKLMLQVHNEGKAVVSSGEKEKAEFDVAPPARPRPLGDAQAGLMAGAPHQARPQGRLPAAAARRRARAAPLAARAVPRGAADRRSEPAAPLPARLHRRRRRERRVPAADAGGAARGQAGGARRSSRRRPAPTT